MAEESTKEIDGKTASVILDGFKNNYGLQVSLEGCQLLYEETGSIESSVLYKQAINTSLKLIAGAPYVVEKSGVLQGLSFWQIVTVRNLSAASIKQESSGFPRMIGLTITDGFNRYQAIEYNPIPMLSLDLVPGQKIILKNVKIYDSIFLLSSANIVSIEGGVASLTLSHNMKKEADNKRIKEFRRSLEEGELPPPPFVPFLANSNSKGKNPKSERNSNKEEKPSKKDESKSTQNHKGRGNSKYQPNKVSEPVIQNDNTKPAAASAVTTTIGTAEEISKKNQFAASQIIHRGQAIGFNKQAFENKDVDTEPAAPHHFHKKEREVEKREVADKRTPLEQLVSRPYGFTTSLSMIVQEMDLSLDDRDPVLNFTLGDEHETVVLFANSTKAVLVDLLDLGPFVSLSNQAFVSSKIEELQDDYIGMMVEMKVTVSGDNPRTYQVVDFDPEPQDNNASSNNDVSPFSLGASSHVGRRERGRRGRGGRGRGGSRGGGSRGRGGRGRGFRGRH